MLVWGCQSDPVDTSREDGCRSCHGSLRSSAPPKALDGAEDTSAASVGAHETHLFGTVLGRPVACVECHLEPETVDDKGHIDTPLPAELTWGPLAAFKDTTPSWNREGLTCSNTYCHGATLAGGMATEPVWNLVDGSQSDCDSCHGNPPPAPHPSSMQCQSCHAPVAGPRQTIAEPSRHGDGVLDVVEVAECVGCHGSTSNAAPPSNLAGANETTELTVGAHQIHLGGGRFSKAVECVECHVVPEEVDSPGHVDSEAPAELTFGPIAGLGDDAPSWDRGQASCNNTYCHGGETPVWNVVDGTQSKCGSCHALPPAAPHPANDQCELCHLPTAGPAQTIADRATHVDGVLQVAPEGCIGCHGTEENLAPPINIAGESDASDRSVGAHQAHLAGGQFSHPVACTTCHVVPSTLDEPGHRDTPLPAELTFDGLAIHEGATPTYDGSAATCTNTYCHGSTDLGATNPSPTWTTVDGTGAPCGSCHGLPPPAPHPASDQCMLCHAPTAGPGQTIADRNTHLDGILQATDGTCADCHGANDNPAPPLDLEGRSDPTLRSVGAHRAHTVGRLFISSPVSCVECHMLPDVLDAPGHIDTPAPAELTWGARASLGTTPSFDTTTLTCSNNYCHGATLSGGSIPSPQWTIVDGSQAACGTCHGMPPTNNHPTDDRCELCHLPTAGPSQTIANVTTHVDGVLQVAADCDSCHGQNGTSAPPLNLDGLGDLTLPTVGAHRTHLAGGVVSRPIACSECHNVPAQLDSPGHIDTSRPAELVFGPIAVQGGATPTWTSPTCSNTYCHGQGGANTAPRWTTVNGTEADCGSCHAIPPSSPVHQTAADCSNCHLPTAGPNRTIANRATHVDGILQVAALDCGSCHGGPQSSAPPLDLDGDSDPTDPQVGAHAAHLGGGRFSAPMACDVCHLVPTQLEEPGHIDSIRPAELTFNGLAALGAATPTYDSTTGTCNNTYCHQAASAGGTVPTPSWTDLTAAPCGGCHGLPPPLPHPQRPNCETCHAPVIGPNRTIAIPARHVDGIIDVQTNQCDSCHGSAQSPAPPRDLAGLGATTEMTVGAHQSHLNGGLSSRAVECQACHVVPQNLADPGHIDSAAPAELSFGVLAVNDGASPVWDRTTGSCNNSYCHGGTLPGPGATPTWNIVDGTQAACGTCHGLPPAAPHPQNTNCDLCHLPTAGPNQTIVDRDTHVDGTIQVAVNGCTGCHGSTVNLAPPVDSVGATATTQRSVGAHQAHVAGGNFSLPVACDTCHLVPQNLNDSGHIDTGSPAEVNFGGRAVFDAAQPTWIRNASTCANTYCHGATFAGGTLTDPMWTVVDGSQAACGTCHALPPPAPHPSNPQCEVCHAPTVGPNQTIADRSTHVDGIVQVTSGACTSCHGSSSSPAPPNDLMGNSATNLTTVGAHRAHVEALSGISPPVACNQCHNVPPNLNSPGHIDTPAPAELTWGALASADGATPSWDRTTETCSNTYCHGSTLNDGTNNAPRWTIVDGSQDSCGSCHGVPPANNHPADNRCELCHLPTAGPNQTIADPSTHLDGIVQAATACDSCHGSNGVSAPPLDLGGGSSTSLLTVGAHRSHLSGGLVSRPVACSECHIVPPDVSSPGHTDTPTPAEIVFGAIAGQGQSPSWSSPRCNNTYCHAGPDAANPNPTWNIVNGTEADCGDCHGVPPNTPVHRTNTDCSTCHLPTSGPNMTIANAATHVDGIVQVTNLNCSGCHGDATSSAPPVDVNQDTATTDREVGAHRVHILGTANSAPVACDTCHLVPTNLNDPGHVDTPGPAELSWSGRSSLQGTSPTYDGPSSQCSNSYCHGGATTGGTNPTPVWNAPGSVPCGGCHGLPPAAPHPQVSNCEVCHAPVAGPNLTIAVPSRHVDGIEDVDDAQPCERCHGTPATPAPPPDLAGLTTSAQVGAHLAHVDGTATSRAVACSECHIPVNAATQNQAGHYDTATPAEVTFGVLARTGGANPAVVQGSCNNTYCHGNGLLGGTNTDPSWTAGAQNCSSCHGAPPPDAVHGNGTATQCESCHPDVAGPGMTIVDASRHVDGIVDTSATCDACHGQNGNSAPPRDLAGLLSSPKVGAHTAHMTPTNGAAVACQTCHLVPQQYADAGHADTPAPAEVTLSGPAVADGANPTYSAAQLRCSNTYCHGSTLTGGTTNVTWDDGDGSESLCGACHGMPPQDAAHAAVGSPNTCNTCHVDSAGPNQTITDPLLHIDGVVQVSGGACNSCHGSPPAPGNESYTGSAGAHAEHATTQGFECATCHGNNGSGPNHNPGGGTNVSRNNVDVVFNGSINFVGGTSMNNGGSASYNRNNRTCAVGCHNPIVGNPAESPNLTNVLNWTANPPGCDGCHDTVGRNLPLNHNVAGLGDAGCLECHLATGHTTGTIAMRDPDPTDSHSYSPTNLQGLCRTCHDGAGGTAFGGNAAPNVSPFWTVSSHGAEGYACTQCHAYHGSTGGPLFFDDSSTSCMASGCHAGLASEFNQVPGGPNSHHRIEGGAGIAIKCADCHNPHLSQASPNAAVDPDNKWSIYAIPNSARTSRTENYNSFCLRCHDGSPPPGVVGALNIATARSSGNPVTLFKKENESLHKKQHRRYSCFNCHHEHGAPGTTNINRGRLLLPYMRVNQFNNGYREENSCSTPNTPGGFSCH